MWRVVGVVRMANVLRFAGAMRTGKVSRAAGRRWLCCAVLRVVGRVAGMRKPLGMLRAAGVLAASGVLRAVGVRLAAQVRVLQVC